MVNSWRIDDRSRSYRNVARVDLGVDDDEVDLAQDCPQHPRLSDDLGNRHEAVHAASYQAIHR